MVIENSELKLLLPPPGGSKGFAGAARPVSSPVVEDDFKLNVPQQ